MKIRSRQRSLSSLIRIAGGILLAVMVISIAGSLLSLVPKAYAENPGLQSTQLLAPYKIIVGEGSNQKLQEFIIYNGYNNPGVNDPCPAPADGGHDHCNTQQYGLDLSNDPDNPTSLTSDRTILAPLSGTIAWTSSDFLGIQTSDGLELWIGHFASTSQWSVGNSVIRGQVLGQRKSTDFHVHISLYNRTTGTPIPFTGSHSLEGVNLDINNNASNAHAGERYRVTNGNWVAVGEVQLYNDPNFQKDVLRISSNGVTNLNTSSLMHWNNAMSSIAIPAGWSVRLYEHPDRSGGTAAQKTYTSNVRYFANEKFGDGTLVNDNVSAVEVFINQCVGSSQMNSPAVAFVSIAEAASLSSPCDGNPTPTPGGPPLPTPPPASDGIQVVAIAPINVTPGTVFNPSVTVKRTNGSLPSTTYLHAVPDTLGNTFNAHPMQGVHYNVAQGNTYTFQYPEHSLFRMTAPQQTGTYQSVWRLNVNNVDVGPTIVIPITVATFNPPHPIDYWNMDVYASKDLSGSVAYHTTTTDQYLFRDWGNGSPAGNVPVDNWSARFVREINFPGGDYHFHCQHDDGCRILIDGTTKLDAWWDASFDGHDWTGTLTPGYHEVKVEFYDQGGGAHMDVWWQGPGFLPRYPSCEPDQWCADFWGNKSLQGYPPMTKNVGTSTFLDIGWSYGGPGDNLPTDYFSARFTRTLPFACGTYRFHVTADDGDRFYV
ncbi:MAG: hypothetical protein RI947_101, partial [Candidatus Parcubacteria bacterium]